MSYYIDRGGIREPDGKLLNRNLIRLPKLRPDLEEMKKHLIKPIPACDITTLNQADDDMEKLASNEDKLPSP